MSKGSYLIGGAGAALAAVVLWPSSEIASKDTAMIIVYIAVVTVVGVLVTIGSEFLAGSITAPPRNTQ